MMTRALQIALLILALLIALLYYLDYQQTFYFEQLTVDELYHDQAAAAIAEGALTASEPFFRAPLYSYYLGLIYALSGSGAAFARLVQLLLGALIPLTTYLLARRLFSQSTALVAAGLTLFCGDLVYFSGELLLESLLTLLLLAGCLLSIKAREQRSLLLLGLLGLIAGLAIVTRPNAAVFALFWLVLLWKQPSAITPLKWRRLLVYACLLLLPVALTLFHNLSREDPAFTLATQGGINFYLGNNRAADGVSAVMPNRAGYAWQYNDLKHLAEAEAGGPLSAAEVSSYYYAKGLDEIAADPLHWLGLLMRKSYLLFSGTPLSNNRDLSAFWQESGVLKLLPIGMWLLGPLGLVGIVIGWRRSLQVRTLALSCLLYGVTFAFFFVNSRFRLPLLPLLAIFSGKLLVWLWQELRQRHLIRTLPVALAAILLVVLANANLYRLATGNRAQDFFTKGNYLLRDGDNSGAISQYYQALSADPALAQVRLNLGVAWLREGEPDSAAAYFNAEDSLTGGSAAALSNLSYLARQSGATATALSLAQRAFSLKPYSEDIRLNLWHSWRATGHSDSAYLKLRARQEEHRLTPQEQLLLAASALDLGLPRETIAQLRPLLAAEPEKVQPDYAELSQPPRLLGALDSVEFARLVHYDLGTAFGQLRQIDSALIHLEQAVLIDSSFAEGWINLASARMALGETRAAEQALLRAEKLKQHLEAVYFNLALLQLRQGDTTMAREYLHQSIETDTSFAPARSLLESLK